MLELDNARLEQNSIGSSSVILDKFTASMTVINAIVIAFSLVTIFMFRNRKRQMRLSILAILFEMALIAMMIFGVIHCRSLLAGNGAEIQSLFGMGAPMPVLGLILLFLAYNGIRKDEALVRSADRLR
jgi:hypothetical protein